MKKKIGFVPMDPVLGAWLLEMLAKEPPERDNAAELCAGVQDLLRGEVTSLLLSASGEGETPAPAESLQLGELEIFPKSRRVLMQGREISLTPKEFDLLVFLASNKGIALSREKILQKVWNYDYFGEDRTVDTHVKMLRGHLGKCRSYIATVWGIGYKFDPDAAR